MNKKYSHYYKEVPYSHIDVYRVLSLFEVTDPCIQHAIKKLLVAGGRGHKNIEKDVNEAIVSLTRWQEMRSEEVKSLNAKGYTINEPDSGYTFTDPAKSYTISGIGAETMNYSLEQCNGLAPKTTKGEPDWI